MRNNGTFRFILPSDSHVDPNTGFIVCGQPQTWINGCECQVEKSVPAKQLIGSDGQVFSYTYNVFIPPFFDFNLCIGTQVEVTLERGGTDVFTIKGIDDTNPKYIEVWG